MEAKDTNKISFRNGLEPVFWSLAPAIYYYLLVFHGLVGSCWPALLWHVSSTGLDIQGGSIMSRN